MHTIYILMQKIMRRHQEEATLILHAGGHGSLLYAGLEADFDSLAELKAILFHLHRTGDLGTKTLVSSV